MYKIQFLNFENSNKINLNSYSKTLENLDMQNILSTIASKDGYALSLFDIAKYINLDHEILQNYLLSLENLDLISKKSNTYAMNIPFYLNNDLEILLPFIETISNVIAKRISNAKNAIFIKLNELYTSKIFKISQIAYHIVGNFILNNIFFEYLRKHNIISSFQNTYMNNGSFFYVFNKSHILENYSNELPLAQNFFSSNRTQLTAFGNINILKTQDSKQFRSCNQLNKTNLPIFFSSESQIIYELSNLIFGLLENYIRQCLLSIKNLKLSAFSHNISSIDLSNSIWKLILGRTNECLIEIDFYDKNSIKSKFGYCSTCIYIDDIP